MDCGDGGDGEGGHGHEGGHDGHDGEGSGHAYVGAVFGAHDGLTGFSGHGMHGWSSDSYEGMSSAHGLTGGGDSDGVSCEDACGRSHPESPVEHCVSHNGMRDIPDGVEIRVEAHRVSDIPMRIQRLADGLGLVSIDHYQAFMKKANHFSKGMIEVEGTFGAPPLNPCHGTQPEGQTQVWRTYWQVGHRRGPLSFAEIIGLSAIPLVPYGEIRGLIEVTAVTWSNASGYQETLARVVVKYKPVLNLKTGEKVPDKKDTENHVRHAQRLAEKVAFMFGVRSA